MQKFKKYIGIILNEEKINVNLKFLVDYKKLCGEQRYKNKVLLKSLSYW